MLGIARWPIFAHRRAERESLVVAVEQEGGDAAVAGARRDGGEDDVELRDAAVGDPRLLAVEHVAAVDLAGAVVRIAAASEPTSGSVVASAVIGGRSPVSGRSQRSFCSSVPSASTGSAKKPLEVIRLPMPGAAVAELLLHQAAGEARR